MLRPYKYPAAWDDIVKVCGLFERDLAVPREVEKAVVHFDGDGLADGSAHIERNGDGKIFGASAGPPGSNEEMVSSRVSPTCNAFSEYG